MTAAIALVVASAALGGVAASQSGGGDQFTGCLTAGGTIVKTAVGGEPLSPCATGQSEISWNQTGPPGPPGPSTLTSVYETSASGDVRFEPGDPAMDFMRLDLPAGNYMFYVTSSGLPELSYDSEGNVVEIGPGGGATCRFFEEAADGTRVDLTGVKHGDFLMSGFGIPHDPNILRQDDTYIHSHPNHPEGAAVVVVCEHFYNDVVEASANWSAVPIGDIDNQPS